MALTLALVACGPTPPAPSGSLPATSPAASVVRVSAGEWVALADLPAPVTVAAFAAAGDVAYVAGGLTDGEPSALAWRYDVAANAWTELPPLPTARAYAGAVIGPDGRFYVISGSIEGQPELQSVVEAYDPADGQWHRLADALGGWSVGAAVDGESIVSAGDAVIERYDIGADQWAEVGSYVEDVLGVMSMVRDPRTEGLLLYAGGTFRWLDESLGNVGLSVTSPAAHGFLTVAPGPDGLIYELGGEPLTWDGARILNGVQTFDTRTAEWAEGPELPEPLGPTRAVGLPDRILALGITADGAATRLYALEFAAAH